MDRKDYFVVLTKRGEGDWNEAYRFHRLLSAENYAFGWMEDSADVVEIRHKGYLVMRGQYGCARNYAPYNDIVKDWCNAEKMPVETRCAECKCQW